MFGATILVPILTGLDTAAALFTAGTGTLIYIVLTGAKVPAFLGSSFAIYSKVWFNTQEPANAGEGIINFLSNEPPLKQRQS
jgi:xanthine/uracil permease